jgi:5-methylthioadenosine/S-adenosylhomocysteine deaminase
VHTAAPPGPILLEGGYVLTLDDDGTRGRLSVAVEDGHIAAIGPAGEVRARFPAASRVRCSGSVIMPGLVNAHLHPDLHVLKGAVEELGLHDWRGASRYNAGVSYLGTPEGAAIQRTSIRASLAEAALSGTTCVGTYGVTDHADIRCEEALGELGLRGTVTIRDDALAPAARAGAANAWDRAVPAMYRLHAEERLDAVEIAAAVRAHERGDRLVMHAAETAARIAMSEREFGTTTIRLLHRHGLLSPQMLLSHAIHIDDEEIALMARSRVNVVVSPAAEMKLGDGLPRVHEMLQHGIAVALGTDAAVCNNATDMFLEMRLLGLSQKLRYGAAAMTAEQILLTATRSGAHVLGGAGRFGCLAEGMAADLIRVDVRNPRMQPLIVQHDCDNLAANLVYAATGSDVTDVMVAGRWIVRRRRLLTTDSRALWSELNRAARTLCTRLECPT